jgi:hypothetical protein
MDENSNKKITYIQNLANNLKMLPPILWKNFNSNYNAINNSTEYVQITEQER